MLASREVGRTSSRARRPRRRGELRSAVDRTFTLDDAAEAIDHLSRGHVRGKVAITV